MKQVELEAIITQYPECLTDARKLRAILLDLYPEVPRGFICVLCTVQSAGIVAEIRKKNKMDESDAFRYRRFLEDNYGMSGEFVNRALLLWKSVLIKPDKMQERQSASPAIQLSEKKIPFPPVSETEDDEESDYAEGPDEEPDEEYYLNDPEIYEPYENDDVDGSWESVCNYGYCDKEDELGTVAPGDDDANYPDYYWEDVFD